MAQIPSSNSTEKVYVCSTEVGLNLDENGERFIIALTQFVLPLLQKENLAQYCNFDGGIFSSDGKKVFQNGFTSGQAAGRLVEAFKTLVVSLLPVSSTMQVSKEEELDNVIFQESYRPECKAPEDETEELPTEGQLDLPELEIEKQDFLNVALQELHLYVFNKMPIRMLMFNELGENITLVERPDIYRYLALQMETVLRDMDFSTFKEKCIDVEGKFNTRKLIREHTRYAILSHTWTKRTPGEVTYNHWVAKAYDRRSEPYAKLVNFCCIAAVQHKMIFGWMDTICINKDSSSELDESIRSMYRWYKDATVCIAYLADTKSLGQIHKDTWFTRGWTLQELVASDVIKFHGHNWIQLVESSESDTMVYSVLDQIETATSISGDVFKFKLPLSSIPISQRMQWMSKRRVTREEDIAYSLMGIFNVSISIAYGEGSQCAFLRLIKEILTLPHEDVLDVTNWGVPSSGDLHSSTLGRSNVRAVSQIRPGSSLIPTGPDAYAFRETQPIKWFKATAPNILTSVGLSVSMLLMPVWRCPSDQQDICRPRGSFFAHLSLHIPRISTGAATYFVLDFRALRFVRSMERIPPQVHSQGSVVLGVLNFGEESGIVRIPRLQCFSIALTFRNEELESSACEKLIFDHPITFALNCIRGASYHVPKHELYKHGMVLRTMYL